MYTSGHIYILQSALRLFNENIRANFLEVMSKLHKDSNLSMPNLLNGLKYPDFPCGKYYFINGRITMKKTLCSFLRLIDDIVVVPNLYSISYSSHNGYFSIWHAMTYDPARTVKDTTNDVIDHVMAMCKLAVHDETLEKPGPNSFWLGLALHTIMDSYSPAHILRYDATLPKDWNAQKPMVKKLIQKHQKEIMIVTHLKDAISKFPTTPSQQKLEETVDVLITQNKITNRTTVRDIKDLSMFFLFHNQEINEITKIHTIVSKTLINKVISDPYDHPIYKSRSKAQPIITYYYYPTQSAFFHKHNDLIAQAKKHHTYDQCVVDCCLILSMYKETLALLYNKPITNNERLAVIYGFLRKIYKYLTITTFAIHPECENNTLQPKSPAKTPPKTPKTPA